jgi:signal transduction histidine kinase
MKARPDKYCNRNPIVIVEGTGLGLYIIEAHSGKIWAQNNNGKGKSGAKFSFSLPLVCPF